MAESVLQTFQFIDVEYREVKLKKWEAMPTCYHLTFCC